MAAVPELDLSLPPELENGVYANSALVSHTPLEFTLDFALLHAPRPSGGDRSRFVARCPVVARVKIPPAMIFDLLQALNQNMTRYEAIYGEIRRPGRKEEG